ncbi:polyamine oxidase 1-like [Diaphorina citri]|uniref:Polyamine oxidase 1-like n=1 Tax=Diaphorina citri TaxID=121845 RepID=A0A3Q0J4B6_DIACI|nr:polyamine oxidase 1-like [Diaphorina citri]
MKFEIPFLVPVLCMVSILPLVKSADAPEKHKLIIIGAGAAGIAAATKLVTNGIEDLIILEAEDRLGGRIHNIPYEGDTSVDLGAQWVHGQDGNVVYELAKPFGLIADECDNSSNYYSVNSSGVTFNKEVDMALFDAIDAILDGEEIVVQNGSIGEYVQQR